MFSAETSALPTLQTPRLRLRALTATDVPALFAIFSDPAVMRYWSSAPLADSTAAEALLAEIQQGFATRTLYQWGVARLTDDHVIGTCTLYAFSPQNRRAELGYALGAAHWGQGYMQEALNELLKFAFAPAGFNLHRLEADADPRNASSTRALTRLGFQREGYLPERWFVNGELCDTVLYGLLARDWAALHPQVVVAG